MYFLVTSGKRKLLPLACTIALGSALFYSPAPVKAFLVQPGISNLQGRFPLYDPYLWTIGNSFNLSRSKIVNALGVFDGGGPGGLPGQFEVGLWNSTQTLLATANISGSDQLNSSFRWAQIPEITLAAGDYVVGSIGDLSFSSGNGFYQSGTFNTVPYMTYTGDRQVLGSTLAYPSNTADGVDYGNSGLFGANVSFRDVPGPLPIFGAAAAFGFSRKLRKWIKSSAFN